MRCKGGLWFCKIERSKGERTVVGEDVVEPVDGVEHVDDLREVGGPLGPLRPRGGGLDACEWDRRYRLGDGFG